LIREDVDKKMRVKKENKENEGENKENKGESKENKENVGENKENKENEVENKEKIDKSLKVTSPLSTPSRHIGRIEVWLHLFLTSALCGDKWSASPSGRVYSQGKILDNH
jgi:hypothetical protein